VLRSTALQDGPHIRPKYADLHCVRLHGPSFFPTEQKPGLLFRIAPTISPSSATTLQGPVFCNSSPAIVLKLIPEREN
jgi:hypothetical protein